MATIIASCSQKGGSGKTTSAMMVAGGLAHAGYAVLLVDADPQQSATQWRLNNKVSELPFELASMPHAGIARDLPRLVKRSSYEIVIIDCPPGVANLEELDVSRAALACANVALVPLRPSALDMQANIPFVRYLQELGRKDLRTLVFINGMQGNKVSREAHAGAKKLFGPLSNARVLNSSIGQRTPIVEAPATGTTIFQYAPRSVAASEYAALTKEIIECLAQA